MANVIVGFVGEQASGKDFGATFFAGQTGANVHKFSSPMSDCLGYLGIPNTRENLIDFSVFTRRGRPAKKGFFGPKDLIDAGAVFKCLKRLGLDFGLGTTSAFRLLLRRDAGETPGFGDSLYSKVIADAALADPGALACVTGIRLQADVECLISLPCFRLVYVTAPVEVRYERLRKRAERPDEAGLSMEEFLAHERAPTEIEIPRIGERAHFRYSNVGSIDDYQAFLKSVIAAIG